MERPVEDQQYWDDLIDLARSDVGLALAQHLGVVWTRLRNWYPFDAAWRRSPEHAEAIVEFERHVLWPLSWEDERDSSFEEDATN